MRLRTSTAKIKKRIENKAAKKVNFVELCLLSEHYPSSMLLDSKQKNLVSLLCPFNGIVASFVC